MFCETKFINAGECVHEHTMTVYWVGFESDAETLSNWSIHRFWSLSTNLNIWQWQVMICIDSRHARHIPLHKQQESIAENYCIALIHYYIAHITATRVTNSCASIALIIVISAINNYCFASCSFRVFSVSLALTWTALKCCQTLMIKDRRLFLKVSFRTAPRHTV